VNPSVQQAFQQALKLTQALKYLAIEVDQAVASLNAVHLRVEVDETTMNAAQFVRIVTDCRLILAHCFVAQDYSPSNAQLAAIVQSGHRLIRSFAQTLHINKRMPKIQRAAFCATMTCSSACVLGMAIFPQKIRLLAQAALCFGGVAGALHCFARYKAEDLLEDVLTKLASF
jgi:hypothetical protein